MKKFELNKMKKGWFVGNFEPVVYRTSACEVSVKHYKKGEAESPHFHKQAEEVTVVISGKIRLNQLEFKKGEIALVEKNEIIKFMAIEDSTTVVFKSGSYYNDKYIVEKEKND